MAEQWYESGLALFEQERYHEALIEFLRAENVFRELDARGQPFSRPLANGISGLANTLVMSGRCCQKLGNYSQAITHYETSLINAKFEKKKPFHEFLKQLTEDMTYCYERVLDGLSVDERNRLIERDPDLDVSFRFPYSLPPALIPLARLYDLAPQRYSRYAPFYERAQERDASLRRSSRTSDESAMKRMSFYVWGILSAVWIMYALIVIRILVK
ncbi:MAG TPA: tetratricopeptide repeat protein [Nitrospirota bacterium]|nr:tetratricopeptide repeat protein [Nitrospirota bacterium]